MQIAVIHQYEAGSLRFLDDLYDINTALSHDIETRAKELGLDILGRVRYDQSVTTAQVEGRAVVESSNETAAADIRTLWSATQSAMNEIGKGE